MSQHDPEKNDATEYDAAEKKKTEPNPEIELSDDILLACYEDEDGDLDSEDSSVYQEILHAGPRYERHSTLGSGGMKNVHRVLDHKLNIYLAMAKPREHVSEEAYDLFLQEARLTALLDHPNIISIHDIGVDEQGKPYFTMDLKGGTSLSKHLKSNKINTNEALPPDHLENILSIFLKICHAISYAHRHSIAHLDIKPDNIQVGDLGEVLVCDWGTAKTIGAKDNMDRELIFNHDYIAEVTMHGTINGTPGYMSPEQVSGEALSLPSDIFGLGCLLYTMICTKNPFEGTIEEQMAQTKQGQFELLHDRFPKLKVPPSLNAVVKKAMSLDPLDRYPSAEELQQDILSILSHRLTEAEDYNFFRECLLLCRRNPTSIKVVGLAISLITIITFIFFIRLNNEKKSANDNHHKASTALIQLEKQKKLGDTYLDSLEAFALERVFQANGISQFEESLEICDELLSIYPDGKHILWHKFIILFALQRFNQAVEFANKHPDLFLHVDDTDVIHKAYEYCCKYAPTKTDNKALSFKDSLAIFKSIESADIAAVCFRAEIQWDRPDYEHVLLIVEFLKKVNPEWNMDYSYSNHVGSRILTLRGKGLQTLNYQNIQIIAYLWLMKLDISGTSISNLIDLRGLKIQKINIHHTQISSLNELHYLEYLNTLIVGRKQFSNEDLGLVPSKVIIKKI
ncbi:MAG: serine/threonine protein kinase [Planctomycetes bacterium]|nr:serine/threonine protein kinase [Planctomycetota bacterium]